MHCVRQVHETTLYSSTHACKVCMELSDYFRRQFAYDEWANREALAVVRKHASASARPLQLMSHILSAERLWLERLTQQPQSLPVWPEFNVEQGEAQAVEVHRQVHRGIAGPAL